MTRPTATPDESTDEPTDARPSVQRRPLIKALTAGAALSVGSGVTSAARAETDAKDLDPHFGFSTLDVGAIPEDLAPDHEVELHIVINDPETDHASFYAHFEPTGLQVEPGDIVQFTYDSPEHTISAYRPELGFLQRIPDGAEIMSSPIVGVDGAWLYRFDQPGVYDLFCGPHHVFGMNMRLLVGDAAEADTPASVAEMWQNWEPGEPFPPWNAAGLERELNEFSEQNEGAEWSWLTPQEVLDAPSLDPMTIQEEGPISFETVLGDIDRFGDTLPEPDE